MSRVIIGPYHAEKLAATTALADVWAQRAAGRGPGVITRSFKRHAEQVETPTWQNADKPWPGRVVIVLATSNETKITDNETPLMSYDLRVVPHGLMFGSADSEEKEANSIEISRQKARISIEDEWALLSPKERAMALRAIGVEDARHVIIMAEDRELQLDPVIATSKVWDRYKQGADTSPLALEAFQPGHLFPGKRVNELMSTTGGTINFLDCVEEAKRELGDRGVKTSDTHATYITYFLKPLEPGLLPLPDDGIYIAASDGGRKFRPVLQEDRELERAGTVFELDHFDVPSAYQKITDTRGRPKFTIESLRSDRTSPYFRQDFPAARAMHTLVRVLKVPALDKPRVYAPIDVPDARLISNRNLGEGANPASVSEEIGGYKRTAYTGAILSHADLEQPFHMAQGVVIEPISDHVPAGVDPVLFKLVKKLEALAMLSNRLTLKPLADDSAFGRPIAIHRSMEEALMPWYYDAAKFRAITVRPDAVFRIWEDEYDLMEIMGQGWDPEKYKQNNGMPNYNLTTRMNLALRTGIGNTFVCSPIGSATSHIPSGNKDALDYNRWCATAGITQSHGGGGRYIMRRFFEGGFQALRQGRSDFLNIAFRVPIASRKEGSLQPLVREFGLELDPGCSFDKPHYSFANGRFHVLTVNHIGERQHGFLGAAHVVPDFIGGAGTGYERWMVALHNAYIKLRGYGLFPGFDNERPKRLQMVSSRVKNGSGDRGYHDVAFAMFTPQEREMMNMHMFETAEAAMRDTLAYADSLGFEVDDIPELNTQSTRRVSRSPSDRTDSAPAPLGHS